MSETDFKETVLGPVPEDWDVVTIGDIFETKQGKQLSSKEAKEGKIIRPFLRTSNVFWGKIDLSKLDTMPFRRERFDMLKLMPGDILVCEGGDIGRTAIWNNEIDECSYQNHLHRLRSKDDNTMDTLFFALWMEHAMKQRRLYVYRANRTTIPNLSASRLKSFEIPLPPLPEQKRIAAVLSTVQRARESTEAVIDAARELKRSMMKHLFTYGPVPLDGAEGVRLKETEIGPVPEDWDVVRLGDVTARKVVKIQNGFPCGNWNEKGIGIPQLRPFNISEEGRIVFDALKFIQTDRNIERYLLQKGDVIFNNTNSEELVGKTAHWDKKDNFVLSNHMTIIRILGDDVVHPLFLATYLHKKWFDGMYIGLCRRHVNQASISLARLKEIQIPLPPLPTQQRIAEILTAIDRKIEAGENRKKALNELFKTLLNDLMTAKIRVNTLQLPDES